VIDLHYWIVVVAMINYEHYEIAVVEHTDIVQQAVVVLVVVVVVVVVVVYK